MIFCALICFISIFDLWLRVHSMKEMVKLFTTKMLIISKLQHKRSISHTIPHKVNYCSRKFWNVTEFYNLPFLFLAPTLDSHVFIPKLWSSLYSVEPFSHFVLKVKYRCAPLISPNISELYITLFAPYNLNESFDIFQAELGLTWRCWVYESVLS